MTLLVYKDGVLAADRGCTRFDSREEFEKIFISPDGDAVCAYAGETDAILRHWALCNSTDMQTDNPVTELPPMNCEGLCVLYYGDQPEVYEFSCWEANTGRGMLIPLAPNRVGYMGNSNAIAMAMGVVQAQPTWSAAKIIREVAEICNAVDIKYGISTYNIETKQREVLL